MSLLPSDHPYWLARSFVNNYEVKIAALHFSYYEYIPQSLTDTRDTFRLAASEFLDSKKIIALIQNTPAQRELAFHSRVDMLSVEVRHIPMIDMSTCSAAQLANLRPNQKKNLFQCFKWYK